MAVNLGLALSSRSSELSMLHEDLGHKPLLLTLGPLTSGTVLAHNK